jgi:signal transduction histidine kinase
MTMTNEPVKFLLVDDIEENLVALEALLRREGLEILKARSGAEALELLLVHDVALAFLDVQMPEMNGFELAELMRGSARTKHVPIIFVTAGARDPQRVFAGYEAGAVDFLFKPIDPHILKSKADVFFELHRHRIALAHDLRMHEMFVGVLGHDLRNPLSSIMTGARFLERKGADEAQLRTLRRILSSASRMNDMIEQLLDLTRARLAGGMGFVRTRRGLDVDELVGRAVDELRVATPGRQVALSTTGDCRTIGDATRLLQVFSNLVSNALHHGAKEAPVTVTVAGGPDEIVVAVHNQGVIAPEILPQVFDPFRGARRTSGSQGLGLGLFISREVVEAHGGSISVASTSEAGTTFTVRLPRAANDVAGGEAASKRVLVVDDDEDVREALGHVLSEAGYEADTAATGREALDRLAERASRPDVVILDILMPELDGARLYEVMRANPSMAGIPVIVSTSSPARAPEGAFIVPKPVEVDRLLSAIAEICREAG